MCRPKNLSGLTWLGMLALLGTRNFESCFAQLKTTVFEDSEFLFFNETANFSDADVHCQSFLGNLARISNNQEFSFVLQQFSVELSLVEGEDFWIGT